MPIPPPPSAAGGGAVMVSTKRKPKPPPPLPKPAQGVKMRPPSPGGGGSVGRRSPPGKVPPKPPPNPPPKGTAAVRKPPPPAAPPRPPRSGGSTKSKRGKPKPPPPSTNKSKAKPQKKYSKIMNINLNSVLNAIRKRPTHKNIMNPGYGVCGYCLTKDPMFGFYSSKLFLKKKSIFRMSKMALKINKKMPNDLNQIIRNNINKKTDRILIVGVSYKKNVGDTRYSASKVIFDQVKKLSNHIDFFDPYVQYWSDCKLHSIKNITTKLNYDLIIFLVDHDILKKINKFEFKPNCKIIEVGNIINSNLRNKLINSKNQIYINY